MSAPHAPSNRAAIFWISVVALFTAALANSLRAGTANAIKSEMIDPFSAANSGELIGGALGNSFLGFALSLLVISPFLDRFGAKKVILFASACFIAGPALMLIAPQVGGFETTMWALTAGMVISGFGWGATEASINPLTTTLYPDDKTGRLNVLHAWWPAGIVAGGLISFFLGGVDWRILIALIMIPGIGFGIWALRHDFPVTESTAQGVSWSEMMAEPFRRPGFWIFPAIMLLTASAELAPGAWVDVTLTNTVGMRGILLLVYVSALMFVMRHFAGALEHRLSDIGLLWLSTIPAAIGLYLLAIANSPVTAIVAATLWAFGVCFMWPTMLATVARRYPKSGSWGIGIVGFAGALAIQFVLPKLGAIYDSAKLERAGGESAFKALQPGTPGMQEVLAYAAEVSFKQIAIIPVILFFVFGAVWLFERRGRAAAQEVPAE